MVWEMGRFFERFYLIGKAERMLAVASGEDCGNDAVKVLLNCSKEIQQWRRRDGCLKKCSNRMYIRQELAKNGRTGRRVILTNGGIQ